MGMIANYQSTTDIELEKFMCLDDVEEAQENLPANRLKII